MLELVPFEVRVGLLLGLMALVALGEVAVRGSAASRWKEYLFLLGVALLGAAYGAANDLVTSSISPEYFSVGKQIAPGPGFLARVIRLGVSAGFFGGAIAACALLYANNPHRARRQLPYRRLARFALLPAAFAFVGSVLGYAVGRQGLLGDCVVGEFPELDAVAAESFSTVWATHAGLYLGLLLGAAISFARVRVARRP